MEDNLNISYSDHDQMEEYSVNLSFGVSCVILLFAIWGTISNLISVIIYSHPCMRSPINVLLTGLSVIDMCVSLFSIPTFVVTPMCVYWPDSSLLGALTTYGTLYLYPLANMAQSSSVWTFVVITFERWVAVCRPFRARWSSTSRSIKALICVCSASILYNMIRFFEYQPADQGDLRNATDDSPACNQVQKYLRLDKYYDSIYYSGMYLVTHFLLPFTILALVNTWMIYSIHKAKQQRRQLSHIEKKEYRTTTMMAAVIFMFLSCDTLPFVLNFIEQLDDELFKRPFMYALNDLSNLLVLVNASTTCFIYYACSQKYRQLVHYYLFNLGVIQGSPTRTLSIASLPAMRGRYSIVAASHETQLRKYSRKNSLFSDDLVSMASPKSSFVPNEPSAVISHGYGQEKGRNLSAPTCTATMAAAGNGRTRKYAWTSGNTIRISVDCSDLGCQV